LWNTFTSGGSYTEKMYWWYIAVSIYTFLHSKFVTIVSGFEVSSIRNTVIIIIISVLDSADSLWTDRR